MSANPRPWQAPAEPPATLRDEFAKVALFALILRWEGTETGSITATARDIWRYADEALIARQETGEAP